MLGWSSSWQIFQQACWRHQSQFLLFLNRSDFLTGWLLLNTLFQIWWNEDLSQLEWRLLRPWLNGSPGRRPENTYSVNKISIENQSFHALYNDLLFRLKVIDEYEYTLYIKLSLDKDSESMCQNIQTETITKYWRSFRSSWQKISTQ